MAIQHIQTNLNGITAYPVDPQFIFDFQPDYVYFSNESTTIGIYVSYDGVTDHAWLDHKAGASLTLHQKSPRLWLRAATNPGAAMLAHGTAEQCGRGA